MRGFTSEVPAKKSEHSIADLFNAMKEMNKRFDRMDEQLNSRISLLNSRIGDLEKNVQDISSIKGAVDRMGVGFQEIPYHMNGNSAVEKIKDYY
jgi:hypothetical protein